MAPSPHWKEEPDGHDYPAALSFLSLVLPPNDAKRLVKRLRGRPIETFKAKDLLRASRLPLLDADNPHVAADLERVARGERLSPVLLVRGNARAGVALTIADGYHRICASHHLDENAEVPGRLTELG